MKQPQIFICTFVVFLTACDPITALNEYDFLKRANIFYQTAISDDCRGLEKLVRYPILMDGMFVDGYLELEQRCQALSLSAEFLAKRLGTSKQGLAFKIYESGWMNAEFLKKDSFFKIHTDSNSDISFFLLEVILKQNFENNGPLSIIYRRDYDDEDGDWEIIMFEDYSLSDLLNRE